MKHKTTSSRIREPSESKKGDLPGLGVGSAFSDVLVKKKWKNGWEQNIWGVVWGHLHFICRAKYESAGTLSMEDSSPHPLALWFNAHLYEPSNSPTGELS